MREQLNQRMQRTGGPVFGPDGARERKSSREFAVLLSYVQVYGILVGF